MPFGGINSQRALILTARHADSEVASRVLREAGEAAHVCHNTPQLVEELTRGAGFVIITQDVATRDAATTLQKWIAEQPAWSDIPVIVLAGRADEPGRIAVAEFLHEAFGNVTLLERPFHPTTLVSVAHAALRSRRRQYEARELITRYELLARELQHRTKNLLAVILSIASGSFKNSEDSSAFVSRLHALAKAQDLLTERAEPSALLGDVLKSVLEGFGDRISFDGPSVFLKPVMAQGFALIAHELATNSAKHGALQNELGTVAVRWLLEVADGGPVIKFTWKERGGPPSTPPEHRGFGTVLLEKALATRAPPRFDYSPEGFCYALDAAFLP